MKIRAVIDGKVISQRLGKLDFMALLNGFRTMDNLLAPNGTSYSNEENLGNCGEIWVLHSGFIESSNESMRINRGC